MLHNVKYQRRQGLLFCLSFLFSLISLIIFSGSMILDIFKLHLFIYLLCMCTGCMCSWAYVRVYKTTCWSWFSSSMMWVPGIEFRGLAESTLNRWAILPALDFELRQYTFPSKRGYINANFSKKYFKGQILNFAEQNFSIYQDEFLPGFHRLIYLDENVIDHLLLCPRTNSIWSLAVSLEALMCSVDWYVIFEVYLVFIIETEL